MHTEYPQLHCVFMHIIIVTLQNAFDEMIKILRFLNQSMDVVGLKGFPVSNTIVTLLLYM